SGSRFAGRFDLEEEPKVYLERELGLEGASRFYGTDAKVWRWKMRWFRSGVKEEEGVEITPRGDLAGFVSVRREDAPGPRLTSEAARALSNAFLARIGIAAAALKSIEVTPVTRPKRTDWTFVDEKVDVRMGAATVRYRTTVSGGEVTAFREFIHVPEAWSRDYRKLRSKNLTAGTVASFGFFITLVAMFGVLISKIVRRDVRWKTVAVFGGIAFVLALLSTLNAIPLTLYEYETSSPLSSHLTKELVLGVLAAIATGAGIAIVVAAAEPIYRERFPSHLSLSGMFSRHGLRTKRFFLFVVLGYALTGFFFAYQAVFYVVAARLGAWAPADTPYSDLLNTAFPWATVLLIGFLPAVSEEGISRMFSISFLDRIGAGRVLAVVLPAIIWGFGHAAYPNQPFYIRGVEVGVAGILMGFLMLRYGVLPLLVWHFTVDAIYTAFLLLRSGNAYYVVSGSIAAGILLLPLAVSVISYRKRGGFLPEEGLTNGDEGFVPTPPAAALAPEEVPAVRRVSGRTLAAGAVAAVLLATSLFLPVRGPESVAEDRVGKVEAGAIARRFLRANGVSPDAFQMVTYSGTGFTENEDLNRPDGEGEKPLESGRIPGFSEPAARYVLLRGGETAFERLANENLPLAFWVVRFFQTEKKEEWKVLVDAKRSRVVAFVNPKEEAAPAAAPPGVDAARARAAAAAGMLGYPSRDYSAVDVGTQDRPKRKDTTVVLESSKAAVGDARPRLTAVFHGSRLAALVPSIKVPEDFLRDYRRRSAADWVLLAAKVVAIGGFVGLGVILFLRLVRGGGVRWKQLVGPLLVVSLGAALALANSIPSLARAYRTEQQFALFQIGVAISLTVGLIAVLCAAAVGFVLLSGGRPGWRAALRRSGSLGDAFARAAIAAVGTAGLTRWAAVAASRFPALFELDPSIPSALERLLPGYAGFWSAATATFLLAAVAATIALARRTATASQPLWRVLALGALLLTLVPTGARSTGEFLAAFLPEVVVAGWLAFCAFGLLKDHAAAWVLFGALYFGGMRAAELLSQPAPPDRAAGWTVLVLCALAAAALLAGRRDRASDERAGLADFEPAAPLPAPSGEP
ncbi:MAG TPA: CPBP family intramembrane glutamic endopeptidase, partial [Thermoanaerobaculia bacterium]|nr:CPBP family intramembrane glutamic endopeptidase [Thermoanaerobaculia bacterium]